MMTFNPRRKHVLPPDAIKFLNEWLDWVEAGAPDGKPFNRQNGLCLEAVYWAELRAIKDGEDPDTVRSACHDAGCWFDLAFGNEGYPFGGDICYMLESAYGTIHLNQGRIRWVRLQTGRPAQHRPHSDTRAQVKAVAHG